MYAYTKLHHIYARLRPQVCLKPLSVNDSSPLYCSVKPKVRLYKGFGTSVCVSTHECVPLVAGFGISLWFLWSFQHWTLNPVWGLKVGTIKWGSLSLRFCCAPTALLSKKKKINGGTNWHLMGGFWLITPAVKTSKFSASFGLPSDWDNKVVQTVCVYYMCVCVSELLCRSGPVWCVCVWRWGRASHGV